MASRGTQKDLSVQQEVSMAHLLHGRRTINTGAGDKDKGDVSLDDVRILVECKLTGTIVKPARSISVKLDDLEKISDEATAEGYTPAVALRITNPDSPIADAKGHIDWIAVPAGDFEWYLQHGGKFWDS